MIRKMYTTGPSARHGARRTLLGAGKTAVLWTAIVLFASCELFLAPEDGNGRTATEADREIFAIHSLAESLSAIPVAEDGALGTVDADLLTTGAVPNDLVRVGSLLAAVVSGENVILTIVENSLVSSTSIDLGTNRNPMRVAPFADASSLEAARWLVATSNLLADSVSIVDIEHGTVVAEFDVGPSPQAVFALAGDEEASVRLLVSNTNYRADRPPEIPYGPGTLTELIIEVETNSEGTPAVELVSERTIDLEDASYDEESEAGLNPAEVLALPATDEIVVICSGVNLLPGGDGADDGAVLVLDLDSLAVLRRITIGGSPSTATLTGNASETILYTAGVDGIRRLYRDAVLGWETPATTDASLFASSGEVGSFFSDCVVADDLLYVADFSGDQLLVLDTDTGAKIEERTLSEGPIALLWDDES